jgi:hypothetical protein
MAKSQEIVEQSMSLLVVAGAEEPIESVDAQLVLSTMNDMMAEWGETGIVTGYTIVNSLDDPVTVQDSQLAAIKYNLAVRIAPHYITTGADLSAVFATAETTFDNLLLQTISAPKAIFPNTLPMGTAQTCDNGSVFFPGEWRMTANGQCRENRNQ